MRGRTELFRLLGGDGGRHVERQHQLIVAELLVELQLGHEAVGEGDDCLDSVLQLAVTEVVQQLTHLKRTETRSKTLTQQGQQSRERFQFLFDSVFVLFGL